MAGLLARIWSTSLLNAARMVAGAMLLHTSFVPRCIITMSGRVADSQPGSWFWFGDVRGQVAAVALVVTVVRDAAARRREGADEVDVLVAGVAQLVPQQGAPAAGRAGDGVAERHDAHRLSGQRRPDGDERDRYQCRGQD